MEMASQVTKSNNELLETDIWDAGLCSEDESGVFVNSSLSGDFSAFQRWSASGSVSTCELPSDAHYMANGHGTTFHVNAECDKGTNAFVHIRAQSQDGTKATRTSIVDCLLIELYETYSGHKSVNMDSFDSSTEASSSDAFLGRSNTGSSFLQELQERHTMRRQMNYLAQKAPEELRSIIQEVRYRSGLQSARLLRQLRRRDRLHRKLQKNFDIITACLQAVSQKRRVDTRLKFTIEPSLGKNGFQQWYDALKAVARLPTGIPKEWRKRVWLTLADQYLHSISIDWEKTLRFAFNERSNPDDDSLGIQIVKDLHRTGCSSYCGQEGEQDRVVLKRVLLAFARWNKAVGYCQGFNVLAALILEVTEGNESDALKVMIYLIDKVLPESYFANNLQALSVDMAVFRDLLRLKLPRLSQHLHHLQKMANREAGGSYEPPLTNVFTMQWFLTMFATCLPPHTVLKIWDSVFFEGSEVLLRVGLAIWERLGERIEYCQTADEFYSTMGCLTQEMLEHGLIDPVDLMQEVYSMAVFPFPQLAELREKYTYNITPFPTSVKPSGSGNLGGWESDDDAEMDDEDSVVTALGCLGPLGGLLAPELQRYQNNLRADQRREQGSIAELSPGAVGAVGPAGAGRLEPQAAANSMMMERMSTDIGALKQQYVRIKRRQQQQAMQLYIRTGPEYPVTTNLGVPSNPADHHINDKCPATSVLPSQLGPSSPVVNHLLLGKKPRGGSPCLRGSRAVGGGGGAQARTGSQRLPSSPGRGAAAGSPWRAHVRAHRRNLAHARAQLGFKETEEEEREEEREEGEGDRVSRDAPVSPTPGGAVSNPGEEGAGAIEEGVASLDLEAEPPATVVADDDNNSPVSPALSPPPALPDAPDPPPLPLPLLILPATPPRGESDSSGSDSNASPAGPPLPPPISPSLSPPCSSTPSPTPNSSTLLPPPPPSPSVFSPFPSVKRPRRSPAARNLGLYGPTPRTPAVRFPQLSRGLGQSIGAAATTRRQ